ncbi:MAG: HNH endonuclease [Nitrospinota bacterium]|nr:MAG: HNH endonuclease [Nitrospinota bacterium]
MRQQQWSNVLVLNYTYEPLHFCNAKRAIILILQEKAEIVEKSGQLLHSPSLVLPLPTVIRLRMYIRRPVGRGITFSKKNVFLRDNFTCQYCGVKGSNGFELTIDHIIPRSKGGKTCWENVVVACKVCNRRKGDRPLEETDLRLLRQPRKPRFPLLKPAPLSTRFLAEWTKYLGDQ